MPNTSRRIELRGSRAIDEDEDRTRKNPRHYQVGDISREFKVQEGVLNERPFKPIKSFFKFNLKDHIPLFAFHFFKMSNEFLDNDGIVRNPSVSKEAGLDRTNNFGEEGFDPINNYFCYHFVQSITKTNGFKVFNSTRICTFRDKA